jgi:hypothetical protein
MPLKRNKAISTPSNGNEETGRKGTERIAEAPAVMKMERSLQDQEDFLPPMKFVNKKWYVYDSDFGYFKQHEDNYICHLVQKELGDVSSHKIFNFVAKKRFSVHYLGQFHPAIRHDGNDILINVLNGITRVDSNGLYILEKHDSKWCFNGVLPVNYDLEATCEAFKQELQDKLPDLLDQKTVLLFGAYCLIPDCRFGITLFNYGPSHTGKSTIIVHGLGAVFGEMTGCLKLSEICPESYTGLSHIPILINKLLNVGSEIDGREVRDTTNFKRLISGESVIAREAFQQGGEINTCVKLTFNMNELPKINGTSAEVERIRLIHFNQITNQDKRDYRIEKKIKLEGSGIFMLLLSQMKELLKLDIFPHGSENSQDKFSKLRNKVDIFDHFIRTNQEELELGLGPEFEIETGQLDPFIIDFLNTNSYVGIFSIDIFKRRLYARYNLESTQQWRPRGISRNQQKKVKVILGIRKK